MHLGLHVSVICVVFVNAVSSRNKTGRFLYFASDNFSMTLSRYSEKFITVDSGRSFFTLISFLRTPFWRYNLRSFDSDMRLSGNSFWNNLILSFIVSPAQRINVYCDIRKLTWYSDNFLSSDREFLDMELCRRMACRQIWTTLLYVILTCRATFANVTYRGEMSVGDNVR